MTGAESTTPVAEATPIGVRIAGTLSVIVGVLSLVVALAVGLPLATGEDPQFLPLVVGLIAGAGLATGGVLLWRRRRVGVLVVVVSWSVPIVGALLVGEPARGNLLMTAALLLAAANWKQLK